MSALEDPPSEASGLPAAQENIELVGELNPKGPASFGNTGVRTGEIADLAVHKGYAYLNSWDGPLCDRGGTYVVDIRDPAAPKEVSYIAPKQPFYHGEGAHVISISTPAFTGDILAVNDETWGSNVGNDCGPASTAGGGFDLYNVTDPAAPTILVQGAGDRDGGDGPLGEQETDAGQLLPLGLRVAGRPEGLPGRFGQRRARGRRHLRHHEPDRAGAGRRHRSRGQRSRRSSTTRRPTAPPSSTTT